jgi:hypothetical protein
MEESMSSKHTPFHTLWEKTKRVPLALCFGVLTFIVARYLGNLFLTTAWAVEGIPHKEAFSLVFPLVAAVSGMLSWVNRGMGLTLAVSTFAYFLMNIPFRDQVWSNAESWLQATAILVPSMLAAILGTLVSLFFHKKSHGDGHGGGH